MTIYEQYVKKLQNFTKEELIKEVLSLKDRNHILVLQYCNQEKIIQELKKSYSTTLQLVKSHYTELMQHELMSNAEYEIFLKELNFDFEQKKKQYLNNKVIE